MTPSSEVAPAALPIYTSSTNWGLYECYRRHRLLVRPVNTASGDPVLLCLVLQCETAPTAHSTARTKRSVEAMASMRPFEFRLRLRILRPRNNSRASRGGGSVSHVSLHEHLFQLLCRGDTSGTLIYQGGVLSLSVYEKAGATASKARDADRRKDKRFGAGVSIFLISLGCRRYAGNRAHCARR